MCKALMLLPAILALGGCSTAGLPGLRPLTYASPGEARLYVTDGPCPSDPDAKAGGKNLGPLLAAVATGAASKALDNFATALSNAAAGGALPMSQASLNVDQRMGTVPQCVVLVRGKFKSDDARQRPIERDPSLGPLTVPDIYRLDHIVQLKVMASADNSAITFAPVYVRLQTSIDGDTTGHRDLSIALKFLRPGLDPVGGVVVLQDQQLGATPATPQRDASSSRFPYEAPWFGSFVQSSGGTAGKGDQKKGSGGAPAVPAAGAGPVGGGGAVGGAVTQSSSTTDLRIPLTVQASLVETRPTKEGLAFIAAVFNGVKPKLNDAITAELDSEAKAAAATKTTNSAFDASSTYADAYGKAWSAIYTYCGLAKPGSSASSSDQVAKSAATRSAQIAANKAAFAADVTQPFSTLATIAPGDFVAAGNKDLCNAAP